MSDERDAGYVRLYRRMLEWEWYDDEAAFRLFMHLLLKANWKDGRWRGMTIPAGSLVIGQGAFAEELGWSRQKLQRTMDKLKMTGEVITKAGSSWTLVTLANWAKYQGEATTTGQQTGQQPGSNRAATGQQPGTIEEGNQVRRKARKKVSEPEGSAALVLEGLEVEEQAPQPPKADRRDPGVQAVIDHLTERLKASGLAPSIDPDWITSKDGRRIDGNRAAAKHLLSRLAKDHPEYEPTVSACRLIDYVMSHPFHGPRSTRVAYLYRNLSAITADAMSQRTNGKGQPTADKVREGLDLIRAGHLREV